MATVSYNVMIGGEAGQGLATVGDILTRTLVRAGYSIVVTQSYQSRIRGGHNTFAIRVSAEELHGPQESVDVLMALDKETVLLHRHELSPRGTVVMDEAWPSSQSADIRIPFGKLVTGRFANVCALGVVGRLLGLRVEQFERSLSDHFSHLGQESFETNRDSLIKGFQWMSSQANAMPPLSAGTMPGPRLCMHGNEAIALGALSAGMKFAAFYPMTPATSVMLSLAAHAERMAVVVEQAEDEIAALNMAIGASFVGAPSMVATSGGGFALMTEAVSLAAMTETPVVIVVSQRPGPSTGLPTRTEQGDLEFVLHSGHGEFPRAIFCPGSVEECFHMTRKAFEVAEESHGPVFLLTDQFLADSYRSVAHFDLENLQPLSVCETSMAGAGEYRTYAISETGVSPRLFPGMTEQCVAAFSSEQLVVADSDEHDEHGHLTEDLSIRQRMVDKRLRKSVLIKEKLVPLEVSGDDKPDLMLVSWGSTRGAVLEAAAALRSQGSSVATVHLAQIWPIDPDKLLKIFDKAGQVVAVEGNATGQMARLIRRETGFHIKKTVLRYDGLPITPEHILRGLDSV